MTLPIVDQLGGATTYYRSEARTLGELHPLYKKCGGDVPFGKWLEFRDKARKDLFWLGKSVLQKDLAQCHLQVCRQFVGKNFDGVYHDGYTIGEVHRAINEQKREKEMMLLDPRGAFKSTIDGIDAVQWLLNCPDIRILILTGEYKLALAFMSEIKGYFYRPEKTEPTLLQQLFPEYVLVGKTGTSDQPLECPARIHTQKEPSLWVNAIVANLSGWHCDVRKMDDTVTDENSNTVEAREKLKQKIDGTDNLVDEWGFTDIIGTRYFTDDYYGERIKVDRAEAPLRYLCRPCWRLKPEFEGTPLLNIKKEMVDLLFPEKLTFESLRKKLVKNARMFRCQQLNEPAGEEEGCTFTEDVLRAHIAQAPLQGEVYITWDWSFSRTSYSDYSAGTAARVVPSDGRVDVYILEVVFGRWKPSELAMQIVQLERKWKPKQTLIENCGGAELLKMEISKQAQRYQVPLNILWKNAPTQADAKRNRIKGLETLLNDDRLWFCPGAWVDETFQQFMRYTGERKNKGRKDDIPDSIAYQQFFIPATKNNEELMAAQHDREKKMEQQARYEHIFETRDARPIHVYTPPSLKRQLFGHLAHA